MPDDECCFLSAIELRERYAQRELSPVEVTTAVLARQERLQPSLNAFVTATPDLAMAQARAAERAYAIGAAGAMAGIPVSIKDLMWTKGVRTTMGSKLYADFVPPEDAPFVSRLVDAGAAIIGKTTSPEFGWKGETTSPLTGSTRNPWNLDRTPGGSSGGGAAATAAGIGPIAQGSDGAGSIRIPCSFTGLFGLKPSWGLIPYYPASRIPDLSHIGPMTRTVADAALFLAVTAGADARDRHSWSSGLDYLAPIASPDVRGLRVGWSPDLGGVAIEPEVAAIAERALRHFTELGCVVDLLDQRLPDPWPIVEVMWSVGMAAPHASDLDDVRDLLDPGRVAVIEAGLTRSGADLAIALAQRNAYHQEWLRQMEPFDIVVTPTMPCTAFEVGLDHPRQIAGKPMSYLDWTAFTYPFNLTGQPVATVPCGFDVQGLPVGLQIVGRWRNDATVLRAAAAFEQAQPWAQHRPPELG